MPDISTSSVRAKKKLIPELRFPEFVKEREWDIKPLGYLSKEIVEKTKGRKYKLMSITSGLGLVSQMEKFGREIAGNSYKNYYVIHNGDFAYNKSSTKLYAEGEIAMFEDDQIGAVPNSIFTCFRFDQKKIYPTFAKYPFINNLHGNWLRKFIAVGARAHGALQVNSKDLFSVPFPYPSLPEQQKIASCLSSLDELIAAHNDKLQALKDHKKGLMQNLFPQEGQKVPNYRFPEFVKDGEWVEKSLDSLSTKISDGIHATPKYDDAGEYYFINGNNLIEGKIWIDEKTKRVSEEEYNKHKRDLSKSTVLLSINGTIGNIAVYNNEKVILGKSACYINVSEINADKTFIIYYIQTNSTKNYFHSELTGSTIKNLSLKSIKETIIKVPVKSKEQQKIASCLSALDELINAQAAKIEQLQLHKKGLMQGLFPFIAG